MAQITSTMAAKHLKKLNDQRDSLLSMERKAKVFTAAIQEDLETVRPVYDYATTQKELTVLDMKMDAIEKKVILLVTNVINYLFRRCSDCYCKYKISSAL